jgi:hypothetical protein
MLQADMLSMAVIVVVSALAGSFLSERAKLGGIGSLRSIRQSARWILTVGPLLGGLLYWALGRELAKRVPGYYPSAFGWALVVALKGATFDEIVARYGMMTLFTGGTRSVILGDLFQAAFFTLLGAKTLNLSGIAPGQFGGLLTLGLAGTFLVHLVAGGIYARFGLASACLFHFLTDLRFPLHALLGG